MPVPVSWMFSGVEFKIWKHKQFIVKQQQILQGTLSDQVLSVQHSLLAVWHRRVFSASGHHKFSHYYTKTAYHVQFEYIPLCKLYTDCIESSSKFTVFSSYALSLSSVSCVVGSVYFMDNCLEGTLNFVLKIKAYLTRIFAFSFIFYQKQALHYLCCGLSLSTLWYAKQHFQYLLWLFLPLRKFKCIFLFEPTWLLSPPRATFQWRLS